MLPRGIVCTVKQSSVVELCEHVANKGPFLNEKKQNQGWDKIMKFDKINTTGRFLNTI